ncbi:MAG TPA: LLM class flavin-dependent oxidoreductase [Dehalococcoidia bacterium]|nr:LLM class flavin-dependent oxidoreductase [Dehalococcoidia bacterium]
MATVKLGILLPTRGLLIGDNPPEHADLILEMARRVEVAGLDSVWVGDSLTAKPRLEPLAMLAAIAANTQRVRLGTAVLLAPLRQPVLLAQTLATLDLLSKGRMIIGAGVGGAFNDDQKREWLSAGLNYKQRAGRLEEIVQIVKGLSTGEPVSFAGKHFNLEAAMILPRHTQPGGVPILLASHWRAQQDAQINRAARLGDGLISISDSPEEYSQLVQKVRGIHSELGRDPANFEATFYMTVNLNSDEGQAEKEATEWLTRYYGAEIWGTRWGPFGGPERLKERMSEYVEAGAQTLIVRFAGFDPQRQLEVFLEQVAPNFS